MVPAALYLSSLAALFVGGANAAALSRQNSNGAVTPLQNSTINAFTPFAWYSEAAYCGPSNITNWSCGASCEENPSFIPIAAGGDGDSTQFWYVGFDPTLDTIIVAHQGTVPRNIGNILTDLDAAQINFDSDLFPGLDSSIKGHKGFVHEQASTAQDVNNAVQQAISQYNATQITLVGHSMGAAISLVDFVYLNLAFPQMKMNFFGFGLPRVGNQAFANYVDSLTGTTVAHVNNKEDFVPTLPGKFLGYVHPSGQVHILDDGTWVACAGQENESTQCTDADVPNIFDGVRAEHDGPYGPVLMHSACSGLP